MKEVINTIKKPIDAIEKKFGGSWKKILILLGIIVGILLVTNLISTMYVTLINSKNIFTGKIDFNSLKNIKYAEFIFKFLLRQIIFFGSIFVGIYIYTTITKKKFNLVDTLSLILVAYMANYLLQSILNIIYMFEFMNNIKFLATIETILTSTANYYSIAILIFGLQKLFELKPTDKDLINLVIMFVIIFSVRYILYLAI